MTKRTILITGATAGIGRTTALHLARQGHRVFATGRNETALTSLLAEAAGTALETLRLDVTSAESIAAAKALVDRRTEGHGVDVLINNAGYGLLGPVELLDDEAVRAQFDTNVFGLLAVTRAFVPAMRARGEGRVLNVSSVGGRVAFPFFGVYNATKYAVEALSDALRQELSPFGVHVSLIEPGVIRSEFADRAMDGIDRFRAPDSPWAWALAAADEVRAQSDRMAAAPELIARVMERAINARRPRARYVAPRFTLLLLAAKSLLPTRWFDALLTRTAGLSRRRLIAATPRLSTGTAAAARP